LSKNGKSNCRQPGVLIVANHGLCVGWFGPLLDDKMHLLKARIISKSHFSAPNCPNEGDEHAMTSLPSFHNDFKKIGASTIKAGELTGAD
jgi:hypothetical protein